jgi:hypothetical protein|tara:strand:+ start:487 stop:876 length:390 start_codon:yes stop_codon:yes gene_type:complete
MVPVFSARVKSGKVVFDNRQLLDSYLTTLEGKYVHVTVRKRVKVRSHPQNAFYWGAVIKLLCESTEYTDEEMHAALKLLFLKDDDRMIPTLKSTSELTTAQFEEYLEKIRVWAAEELSCVIPLPNEVDP